MENEIAAHRPGLVAGLAVAPGDAVDERADDLRRHAGRLTPPSAGAAGDRAARAGTASSEIRPRPQARPPTSTGRPPQRRRRRGAPPCPNGPAGAIH